MFIGNLSYRGIEFTFVFDGDELRLIPPKDKYLEIKFEWYMIKTSENCYIPGKQLLMEEPFLSGLNTENNHYIIFITEQNSPVVNENGILYVEVSSYLIFKGEVKGINRLCFYSPEIDKIYDSHKAINIIFDDPLNQNGKFSINSEFPNQITTKKQVFYVDDKKVQVHFGINRKINFTSGEPPLVLNSYMYFDFDTTNDYYFILRLWHIAKDFISFLCYRQDVFLPIVDIYTQCEWKQISYYKSGTLNILKENGVTDIESLEKGRFIKYEYIAGNESKILSDIAIDELYSRHIPKSYYEKIHLNEARFIMITAAVEWEFRKNYPDGIKKKCETIEAEKNVSDTINKLIKESVGSEERKLYKRLNKFLDNIFKFPSLETKINQVCKDYSDIIDIFGQYLYNLNNKTLNYNKMSKRVSEQRNNFSHGNLDKEFITDSLEDIIFLEYIVYAMQLKRFGISDENIKKAINELFHINLHL